MQKFYGLVAVNEARHRSIMQMHLPGLLMESIHSQLFLALKKRQGFGFNNVVKLNQEVTSLTSMFFLHSKSLYCLNILIKLLTTGPHVF